MNKNSRGNQSNKQQDSALIKEFLDVQKEKIALDKNKLELQKQQLKSQTEIAKKSIDLQGRLLGKAPSERRKDRAVSYLFIGVIFTGVLGFSIYCLANEHDEFLKYFIGAVTHLATLLIGYYFGASRESKTEDEYIDYEEADI